ncbi:MAG TPA: hypothetical protein VI522_02370, partial [Gammaproteobacteria bacterium]|nr:hypothetical protein [Gammaproteobacteria bacterium]
QKSTGHVFIDIESLEFCFADEESFQKFTQLEIGIDHIAQTCSATLDPSAMQNEKQQVLEWHKKGEIVWHEFTREQRRISYEMALIYKHRSALAHLIYTAASLVTCDFKFDAGLETVLKSFITENKELALSIYNEFLDKKHKKLHQTQTDNLTPYTPIADLNTFLFPQLAVEIPKASLLSSVAEYSPRSTNDSDLSDDSSASLGASTQDLSGSSDSSLGNGEPIENVLEKNINSENIHTTLDQLIYPEILNYMRPQKNVLKNKNKPSVVPKQAEDVTRKQKNIEPSPNNSTQKKKKEKKAVTVSEAIDANNQVDNISAATQIEVPSGVQNALLPTTSVQLPMQMQTQTLHEPQYFGFLCRNLQYFCAATPFLGYGLNKYMELNPYQTAMAMVLMGAFSLSVEFLYRHHQADVKQDALDEFEAAKAALIANSSWEASLFVAVLRALRLVPDADPSMLTGHPKLEFLRKIIAVYNNMNKCNALSELSDNGSQILDIISRLYENDLERAAQAPYLFLAEPAPHDLDAPVVAQQRARLNNYILGFNKNISKTEQAYADNIIGRFKSLNTSIAYLLAYRHIPICETHATLIQKMPTKKYTPDQAAHALIYFKYTK